MKIEQVLVHYLLKNKKLTLQGIGTFQLDASLPDSADSDKPIILPENAISFHYDPKVKEDEGLVDFIVAHTNKIKPLATSDLESFLSLGRQFLNIGNPFTLQNIGTLEKSDSGELVFKAGKSTAQKMEPQKIKNEDTDNPEQEENLFNEYQKERKSNNAPKAMLAVVVLIVLGLIGWAVWHYGFSNKNTTENISSTEQIVPVADSSHHKADSLIIANAIVDSINNAKKNPADSFTFKIVVKQYRTLAAAEARVKQLKSYHRKVIMYTTDSVTYKIAEPFMLPLSDTTRVLDSLKRYYTKIFVDLN